MVKIAVAGGAGNLGQEAIDALVATKKHEILLLSRKDAPSDGLPPGVTWAKADYGNPKQLAEVLQGVDTVLSFIVVHADPENVAQKNLIDAAVQAGVRRFAPSEWGTSSVEHMPWYAGKAEIREYLKNLNRDKKVLEYTLFQAGLLVNYFTYPHQSSKHIQPIPTPFDFANRRALVVDGSNDARITLTAVDDIASVVTKAVEYQGEWPLVGGIQGNDFSIGELIALGERVRGTPFTVERLQADDLKAGAIKSSWVPKAEHPAIPPEQAEALAAAFTSGILLGMSVGALGVSGEWNTLLPDHKFTQAEEFLAEAWSGKP